MSTPVFDDQGRPEPPKVAGETETLFGYLDFLRATIAWKVEGLDADALRSQPLPSAMTLGGLLKHLAYVEDFWFCRVLSGAAACPPWDSVDWTTFPDWDWESAVQDSPEELLSGWTQAITVSRSRWADLSATPDFAMDRAVALPNGEEVAVRWVITHMIEEYGRHCGHADLLREALDGQTGE